MDLTPGEILGDYRIVRELGRGGMAAVYLASHLSDPVRREVALKILLPAMRSRPELVRRFQREAEISGRLRHQGIARALEFVQTEEHVYLVLEYMPGGALADRIKTGGALPWPEAVRILRQVGEALAYAHKQGIVHRDVKPSNILFDADGNAYLGDFGVAYDEAGEALTVDGVQPGTYHYMSPEQIRGRAVDGRADQFALATVFYQMIAGELPFSSTDSAGLIHQIVYERAAPLPPGLDVPYAVSAVLERAHKKEAGQRYASVLDLVEAVEGLGAPQTGARAAPSRRRAPTWLRPVAATSLLMLATAVGVVLFGNAIWGDGQDSSGSDSVGNDGAGGVIVVIATTAIADPALQPSTPNATAGGGLIVVLTPTETLAATPGRGPDAPTPTVAPQRRTQEMTATPTSGPVLASLHSRGDVRAGPGNGFPVVGQAEPGRSYVVNGRTADGLWLQIGFRPTNGWLLASLVTVSGALDVVAVLTPPAPPSASATPTVAASATPTAAIAVDTSAPPTLPPQPTSTPTPPPPATSTPTPQATFTPTPLPTSTPSPPQDTPTPSPQPSPTPSPPQDTPTPSPQPSPTPVPPPDVSPTPAPPPSQSHLQGGEGRLARSFGPGALLGLGLFAGFAVRRRAQRPGHG